MRSQQLNLLQRPFRNATNRAANCASLAVSQLNVATKTAKPERNSEPDKPFSLPRDEATKIQTQRQRAITQIRRFNSYGGHNCPECGKRLRPTQTENENPKLKYCDNCQKLYSTSSGADFAGARKQMRMPGEQLFRSVPYPAQIAEHLDKYVVGQQQAKKALSVGIYQHYRRLENNARFKQFIDSHQQRTTFVGHQQQQYTQQLHPPFNYSFSQIHHDIPEIMVSQSQSELLSATNPRLNPDYAIRLDVEPQLRLEKSNIVLLGPSGVGKTFITEVLAGILNVPIALCDCTSMTQAGYVGEDVESVLQKLYQNADGNLEKAQRGIVVLDEIDKIAATREALSHAYRDVSGEGVQHSLLKMVEGTTVNVKSGRKGQQETVPMDTTDILFIASGAFNGLERVVSRRLDKQTIGFGAPVLDHTITDDDKDQQVINEKRDKLFAQVDQGDMIKFGMIPELVGRFPVLVPFHSFDKHMLVRVLTEPKNSLLSQMKHHFSVDNIELDFTDDALEEIAKQALERKVGARALRSIIERVLLDPKFESPGTDVEAVHITKEYVRGEGVYKAIRKQDNTVIHATSG